MPAKKLVSIIAIGACMLLAGCNSETTAGKDAVAIGGTFQFHSPGGKVEIFYPENERQVLPGFSGDSLLDESKKISLDDFPDQVVVLNVWGQWCAPCRSEVDDLQEIHEALQAKNQAGTVLGINVRDYNPVISRDFIKDNGITYPSVYDPPFISAASLGGVPASVIPTTIVLDKHHRPAAVFLREITAKDVLDVALPLIDES